MRCRPGAAYPREEGVEMSGVYWVIMCDGLQGIAKYETEAEAFEAALVRCRLTGRCWYPRKIYY